MKLYCEILTDESFKIIFRSHFLQSKEDILLSLSQYHGFLRSDHPECKPVTLDEPLSVPTCSDSSLLYSDLINGSKVYRGFIEFELL